jgi:hypothetical protein
LVALGLFDVQAFVVPGVEKGEVFCWIVRLQYAEEPIERHQFYAFGVISSFS